jgi:hypothetical protein
MGEEPLHTSKFCKNGLNQKGSTILSALIMGVVVVIMIFSSATYIRSRAQAVAGSADKMDNRIALDGMLAYTLNGIKQSWCFGDTWTQQTTCPLTDPRNTARLIISDESLGYIAASTAIRPNPLSATRLSQITQTVDLTSINATHPLYKIARPLGGKYSNVNFTIKRDDSAIATTKGREVRLKVLVHLKAISGIPNDDLDLDSQVIVYPRELSYFGLIMPRDLYLGAAASAQGDVGLLAFDSASEKGLRFESPVFVNRNLILPSANIATPMHNVVFLDKVVLGGGMIYQGNSPYSPSNAGGSGNMFTHEMKSFSGLLGGYELDESRDLGLDVLFKVTSSSFTVSESDYQKCLKRIQASYDLSVTKKSQLFTRFNYQTANAFNLSANIGNIDNLIEQDIGPGLAYNITTSIPDMNYKAGIVDVAEGGAVFKVKVVLAGLKPPGFDRGIYDFEFYLSRTGTVSLTPMGVGTGARIEISSLPHRYAGKEQFNEVDLDVKFFNATSLDMTPYKDNNTPLGVQDSIKVFFEAQDYAYNFGKNLRPPVNVNVTQPELGIYKSNGVTFFKDAGGNMSIAHTATTWSTNEMLNDDITENLKIWESVPEAVDWASLDAACMAAPDTAGGAAFYASFPSANWGTSFATQAEHAWRFTTDDDFPDGYKAGTLLFNSGSNRLGTTPPPAFNIKSVVKDCVIQSSANFVTGFYVCETLTISPREEPLRIIGTFITGKLTIDPSAYAAGIRWSSIYHPQAPYELREAKILGKYKDGSFADCDSAALPPLWSPNIGIKSALAHYLCNPVSLRTADPFRWTMVDPDCGIEPSVDKFKVACKSQPRRFLIKEISRTKGM